MDAEFLRRAYSNQDVWDSLWKGESIGRIAVAVTPGSESAQRILERHPIDLDDTGYMPENWTEQWREALLSELQGMLVRIHFPGDQCPAISVPRFVHGQSQGITDIFGAHPEEQADGLYYAHPLKSDVKLVDDISVRDLDTSMYWGAVEWIKYARSATGGKVPFRNPVMTGPLDTAGYLLGMTTLLEWVYTEPDTVHRLLAKITDVIIRMLAALREAAGGILYPNCLTCMRGGFDLCSEVRSIISPAIYEEFEAPYLLQIGEQLGDFGIHSCGSWERTIPSVLANPYIRAMNGQIRENDLETLCRLADGKIALSIGPSVNLDPRYTWLDMESYYRHILETVPDDQPFELSIPEEDIPLWIHLHKELRGKDFPHLVD